MVEYTITICNYNMSETIKQALKSVLQQLDDRFEVLVVDDGSSDGSVDIVRSMTDEYPNLRLLALPADPGRHLGETRNIAVRNANGEHVLLQLDADDVYAPVIKDFVLVYETIRSAVSDDFLFKGSSLTVGSRKFLMRRGPYRNLPVGAEDLDMWRRLLAAGEVIWIEHENPATEIGPKRGPAQETISSVRRGVKVRIGEFQTGISPISRIKWSIKEWRDSKRTGIEVCFGMIVTTYAFFVSLWRPRYSLPEKYRDKGVMRQEVSRRRTTVRKLEEEFGVEVSRAKLSEDGFRVFLCYKK